MLADLVALNAWLEERCLALWRQTPHGKQPGTIDNVWTEEPAALIQFALAFDGFVELSKRVSPTCLISFERNRYIVPASFANRCNDPAESAQFKPLMHMPERVFSWQALGEGACGCRS